MSNKAQTSIKNLEDRLETMGGLLEELMANQAAAVSFITEDSVAPADAQAAPDGDVQGYGAGNHSRGSARRAALRREVRGTLDVFSAGGAQQAPTKGRTWSHLRSCCTADCQIVIRL